MQTSFNFKMNQIVSVSQIRSKTNAQNLIDYSCQLANCSISLPKVDVNDGVSWIHSN